MRKHSGKTARSSPFTKRRSCRHPASPSWPHYRAGARCVCRARALHPCGSGHHAKHSLAEAARRVPNGVLCLLTALQFHGLTTQLPYQVWVAIDPKVRLPKPASPPLRIVRFSGVALNFGVEHHMIKKVAVRIFSPSKTVEDCFKYRNKIELS